MLTGTITNDRKNSFVNFNLINLINLISFLIRFVQATRRSSHSITRFFIVAEDSGRSFRSDKSRDDQLFDHESRIAHSIDL